MILETDSVEITMSADLGLRSGLNYFFRFERFVILCYL